MKQSRRRNFCYGFNFYNDLLFEQNYPAYAVGIGSAVGGAFGKK